MTGTGGKAPKVSATHTVALYDPADGRVVHMHHVVVFEGGKSVSAEEAQREAVENARRRGREVGKLKTLLVDRPTIGGGRFRVDTANKTLIPLEPPARKRPARKRPARKRPTRKRPTRRRPTRRRSK